MANGEKLTPLTDPSNVQWVIERPGDAAATTAAVTPRPKMAAYSALVAATAVSLKKKFDESKVKRGPGGKFAKKAGGGSSAPAPAKKTSAAPIASGKKITNKVIYGKHANGSIIQSTDGQHRMVYNAAGNNWTVQRRTSDGGWEVVEVLGKGAAYKKANALSSSWGELRADDDEEPDVATAATVDADAGDAPDAGTTTSNASAGHGAFADGWNDLSASPLSAYQMASLHIESAFSNEDALNAGLAAQHVANLANKYGVTPEQALAIIDHERGDSVYSDRVRAHLAGQPFPPSTLTVPPGTPLGSAKKIAAKKTAAKKVAPPAVAPSPAPAKKAAKKIAYTNPMASALAGEDVPLAQLEAQQAASQQIRDALHNYNNALADPSLTVTDTSSYASILSILKKQYKNKYGVAWSPSHHAAVVGTYQKQLAKSGPAVAPTSEPATPAPTKKPAKSKTFAKGDSVIGPTGATGEVVAVAETTGTKIKMSKVQFPDGQVGWFKNDELSDATTASSPAAADRLDGAQKGVIPGAYVYTPGGDIATVVGQGPPNAYGDPQVTFQTVSGSTGTLAAGDLRPLTQFQIDSLTNAPVDGAYVSTPMGDGYVVGAPFANAIGNPSITVDVNGTPTKFNVNDVTPATAPTPAPAAPVITPATPAAAPALSYDADGVPILDDAQQAMLQSHFKDAGVNWYSDTTSIFDAAYAASQATGMSMEDVLKYADANYHSSAKFGGKPFQAKVEKWAKSSKGKAHVQATLGTAPTGATPTSLVPVRTPPVPTPQPPPAPANITATNYGSTSQPHGDFFPLSSGYTTLDPDEALELQREMEAQSGALDPRESSALTYYTSESYREMNNCLRRGEDCNAGVMYHNGTRYTSYQTSEYATQGMRPLTQNVTLYRGTNIEFAPDLNLTSAHDLENHVGYMAQDFAFSSASVNPTTAHSWGAGQYNAVIMQIEVPAGYPATYVDHISDNPGEYEMVLPPGTRYRIVEVKPSRSISDGVIVRVEVIP